MAILQKCPNCGLESAEMRCPRCNTLKLSGCSGACSTCGAGCTMPSTPPATRPSDEAADDTEHQGTPLTP